MEVNPYEAPKSEQRKSRKKDSGISLFNVFYNLLAIAMMLLFFPVIDSLWFMISTGNTDRIAGGMSEVFVTVFCGMIAMTGALMFYFSMTKLIKNMIAVEFNLK